MAARTVKKSPFDDDTEPGQDTMPGGDEAQTNLDGFEVTLERSPDARYCTLIVKGTGYDGSSLSVRGADLEDLEDHVKTQWTSLTNIVKAGAEIGKTFSELSGPSAGPRPSGGNSGGSTGTSETPAWVGSCSHGPRVHRSGVKNGKPWEAGFCSEDDKSHVVWKPKN